MSIESEILWHIVSCENEQKGDEKMISKVNEVIYNYNLNSLQDWKKIISFIRSSYNLVKDLFIEFERTSWERYFEHLREVVNITLDSETPSLEKVIISLYHDSIEDIKWYNFDVVRANTKSYKIALAVEAMSKKDWKIYSNDENEWKELRNKEYFWKLLSFEKMKEYIYILSKKNNINLTEDEAIEITQNVFDVKYADRIHNLSTQWDPDNLEKVKRKIDETEKYFLPWAIRINPEAYEKMKNLVEVLKVQIELHEEKQKNTLKVNDII